MASDQAFVEYIAEQIADECEISFRAMFGGYTFYSKGKVVALVCDGQLFVKPTNAGKEFIGDFVEAPAYPGAKPSLLIEEQIEDSEWLSELIAITEKELPNPKPKARKKPEK
ncbi:MAG: TfoX/Sxy family protein [Acidobacteria bacterium]|nr:TfoX/Sxy family protein [Acidobacteriota bacterium]